MKTSIVLSTGSFGVLGPAARLAESAGLDRVWVTETPGRDALIRAVHVAAQTESILVGTGIAYAFTRHPVAMAGAASDATQATGERLTVAIGAGPGPIRSAVGASFDDPARRLAEYIDYVRTALRATEGFEFQGRHYESHLPTYVANAQHQPCDVYGSGAGPRALKAVGAVADGLCLHPLAIYGPHLTGTVLPAVQATGRTPKLAAWCVTSIHPNPGRARGEARTRIAQYLSTGQFDSVLNETEWASLPSTIQTASAAEGWEGAGRLLPDRLIDQLALACTPDEVPDRLAALRRTLTVLGLDEIAFQLAGMGGVDSRTLDDLARIIEAVSPPTAIRVAADR